MKIEKYVLFLVLFIISINIVLAEACENVDFYTTTPDATCDELIMYFLEYQPLTCAFPAKTCWGQYADGNATIVLPDGLTTANSETVTLSNTKNQYYWELECTEEANYEVTIDLSNAESQCESSSEINMSEPPTTTSYPKLEITLKDIGDELFLEKEYDLGFIIKNTGERTAKNIDAFVSYGLDTDFSPNNEGDVDELGPGERKKFGYTITPLKMGQNTEITVIVNSYELDDGTIILRNKDNYDVTSNVLTYDVLENSQGGPLPPVPGPNIPDPEENETTTEPPKPPTPPPVTTPPPTTTDNETNTTDQPPLIDWEWDVSFGLIAVIVILIAIIVALLVAIFITQD
ncbi:hypothetical protein ACFL0W_02440 [Nanoarchaeota archaeon]